MDCPAPECLAAAQRAMMPSSRCLVSTVSKRALRLSSPPPRSIRNTRHTLDQDATVAPLGTVTTVLSLPLMTDQMLGVSGSLSEPRPPREW